MHISAFKIGVVSHYYDKIGVAIVELSGALKSGDKIGFVRGGEDLFKQDVDSIQIEHNNVLAAKKGDVIGLKVKEPIREGAEVFKES